MFDLFRSRQKVVRLMLGGILVVVSLSMLSYLVPSFNSGTGDPSDQVVAEIGKQKLMQDDVVKAIDRSVKGRQLPPGVMASYIPQLVNEMITAYALEYQSAKLGFQVSNEDLQATIRQVFPALFPDGKFVGTETYTAMLAQENMTVATFEEQLRRQLLASRLRNIATAGVMVTPAEVEREYRRKNDKVKVEWVKLTAAKYLAESQPADADVEAYFKTNTSRYTIPEKRDLTVAIADPATLEATITPTDADLQQLYNQKKESFLTPERVRVRHILLKTEGKPATEDAKMKAKAEDLLKQLKAGGNFGELAKKNSEDPGSANNAKSPGELPDWITHGQTVPEFERAAFSLKPNQISDVIKTQYGYHILQVMTHEDAHQRTAQEAKADLTAQWKKQRLNDLMERIADKAQAEFQKDLQHPEQTAAAFGMRVMRVPAYDSSQPLPDVGLNQDFIQSVNSLREKEVTPPVGVDNKIVFGIVTAVTPSRPALLAEVREQVRGTLLQTRSENALQKHSQELADAARKSGELAKLAKSMGLDSKTSADFARDGSVDGVGAASYLENAFGQPDGAILGPIAVADGTVVARVVSHTPADPAKFAEQAASIRDQVKRQKEGEVEVVFNEGIRDTLLKQGKIKIHAPVVQRIVARYGSNS
jgi:peptidyl-prolyl cis-trans isomerase D